MARKRVLLYAHDGTGMGHLRRLSRIAEAMSEEFSTLILSGVREAAAIVPSSCGLIKLPDWEGICRRRAERAGRRPWIDLSEKEAQSYRSRAILESAQLYRPDAFIADYLPLGQRRELQPLLEELRCPRYLVHRGIADTSDSFALRGAATSEIARHYDRIFVSSDKRLGDIAETDDYCEEARAIMRYVGFVAPPAGCDAARQPPYVVCSAGGGTQAEQMMLECLEIARRNPSIPFHVVLGPRSRLRTAEIAATANCEVRQQRDDLPELHRNAAVVVSAGGYNSVLEAALGGAMVIVHPNGDSDEQVRFAELLARHYPVRRLANVDQLEAALRSCWEQAAERRPAPLALERDGAEAIRAAVSDDLATGYRSPHVLPLPDCADRPIVNLDDFRTAARARLDRAIFDYIDGGAGDEVTRLANRRDLAAVRLAPLVLRDVAHVDTGWSSSLGRFALPIGLSPTAIHRLVHERGEIATACAARAMGVPMIVSMMASCSIEEIAAQSSHPGLWLQAYVLKDRGLCRELIRRAEQAGYRAIVVSAGCPVMGKRDRNLANRFTVARGVGGVNFRENETIDHNNPIHSFDGAELDPGVTWQDLEAIAAATSLPVVVKGIVNARDVAPALASGAAALMVSNHGGRQLDGTISSIRALPEVADALAGRTPLLIDGAIRRGTDVVKALAMGADAAFLGSTVLWALAVDGERGVARALDILAGEFSNALSLAGCANIAELRGNASTILRGTGTMQ